MVGAWFRMIVSAAVVAAVVVAAQLGAGEALGILQWAGPHDDRAWITLLTWVAFSYAVAVLAGALIGRGAARRRRGRDGFGTRVAASLVAAAGAAAVIGLAWLPAREIRPPVNANPGLVISITAGAGVLVGMVLALLALAARAAAAGLLTTVSWVWLLAVAAAVVGLTTGEPYPVPRVGMPDAPSLIPPSDWTGPWMIVVAAAVLGLAVAGAARWRGASRLSVGFSGFGGPALVAAAYLIAGPGEGQGGAYLAALLAIAAGLAASAMVAIPGRPAAAPGAGGPTRSAAATGSRDRQDPTTTIAEADATPAGDVLVSTRAPVSTTPPSSGPARPAWAQGSGPLARAYTSGASHTSEPASPPTTRGTGWDSDTLSGTTHTPPSTDRPDRGGGLYRSTGSYSAAESSLPTRPAVGATVMGQPSSDPHESWLRDLGSAGRHSGSE